MERLCSDGFATFFCNLSSTSYSLQAVIDRISGNLPLIADDINLGRLCSNFTIPASIYEPNGISFSGTEYTWELGFADEVYEKSYVTTEGGMVTLKLNPRPGCTWSDGDKVSLNMLCESIFLLCSRTRLMGLMRRVERSDSLTGALNSRGLQESAAMFIQDRIIGDYASVFANIKNLKYINQQVGNANGDVILKRYASMSIDFLGENGVFARLGGDNFLVLVKKTALGGYLAFLSDVTIPVMVNGIETKLRISSTVGVCEHTPSTTVADVMTNSAVACTAAKRSHLVDVMYFRPDMLEKTIHDKGIATMFPESLAKNEFLVYYQPKVDLATGRLCGSEALTRWQRDKLIPPDEFIPVLESEGSIRNLDFYMLGAVCRDIRDWIDRGIQPVRVSINFSKVHLSNEQLEDDILSVIRRTGVPTEFIEIELTELSDYQYYNRLINFVNVMHKNGIHISIDDFGTGYSSIKLVKNLQADVIKLDKSMIDNIKIAVSNSPDKIVSTAIINMAKELHIEVIAEGVETMYQAEFLRQNGCAMAQGFLYDRPLPHDDFELLLTGSREYPVEGQSA